MKEPLRSQVIGYLYAGTGLSFAAAALVFAWLYLDMW
jgi:hypothetical protein